MSSFKLSTLNSERLTSRGYFTLLVLVFASVFFTLLSALTGFVFVEKRAQIVQEQREQAFHIAEAGLEYYRWHLAHWPSDLKDGTSGNGPYEHTVPDPEGGTLGTFSLVINGDLSCGSLTSVTITSTGWTSANPAYKRTVYARYTRPSVADYSAIINSNVWAGGDRVISGPYHSNGGVRMDGTHNAEVTSGVATWLCTSTFGCSPNQTKNGVFGSGGPSSLWGFPAPPVDFNGISVDLVKLKGYATSSGQYLGPSGNYGYKIVLNSDSSFDAYKVTGTTQIWGYTVENGWQQERTIIATTGTGTHYAIPPGCPVVFVEDNVWLQGSVSGKVTIASADVTQANVDRTIVITADINYAHATGDGLTAIGERDVLISLQSPNIMAVNGIFIAQKGHFGRNHYCQNDCSSKSGDQGLPSSLDSYVLRSALTTNGTIVSNGRFGTKWTSGGTFVSGYNQRYDSYDRELAKSPPPFTPQRSDDFTFVDWREQN